MGAQADHSPAPPELPRTIRAVRRALDGFGPDLREQFERELADTAIGDVDNLVFLWWGIAVMGADPQVHADLLAADAGTLGPLHTADEVFTDTGTGWSGRVGE
ncbi:hypothetical protein [Embleya sp. NPDC020630]|uniref:hypothetical protein n=1 Tax=Embleya sp. NPDC020630 TaxID=3363979 RepID=UPI0037BB9DC6